MLSSINLQNFKSARNLTVPLGDLTVLAGLNGSGKSSVLQAIGLLRQSLAQSQSASLEKLYLRGELVQLGGAEDVLSEQAADSSITIRLCVDNSEVSWVCSSSRPDDDILNVHASGSLVAQAESSLRSCLFQFLQADRLTPQTHYDRGNATSRATGFLGAHGEFTPGYLAEQGDRLVVSERRRVSVSDVGDIPLGLEGKIGLTPKLYDQISGWMQFLSPGVRLESGRLAQTDLVALSFSYVSTKLGLDSRQRRPSHVGFGLTYSLPIVTACLSAPSGSLLLLENPEAHLHPRGQAALGALLARCAADGVQIIVETHSDHILNGIRLAVKNREIPAERVRLCNFVRDPNTNDSYIETPSIQVSGELTSWPDGFFDEWEKSLEALLR